MTDPWNELIDAFTDHLNLCRELGEKKVDLSPETYRVLVTAGRPAVPPPSTPRPVVMAVKAPVAEAPVFPDTPRSDNTKERLEALAALNQNIQDCIRCPLHEQCDRKICGSGNAVNPDLFFIGSMSLPNGTLFHPEADLIFDKMLQAIGYSRQTIYFTNAIKCVPSLRHAPTAQEIGACSEHLQAEIRLVNPKIIVMLGPLAVKALFQRNICDTIGKWHLYNGRIHAMPIHHPHQFIKLGAAASTELKRISWTALKKVKTTLEREGK